METAVTNNDDGAFRTRVRVKAGSQDLGAQAPGATAEASSAASKGNSKSLIEALKHTEPPAPRATSNSRKSGSASTPKRASKKKATNRKPRETQAAGKASALQSGPEAPAPKDAPRDVIAAAKPMSGHSVSARLKHLERLKEATAGLERVTSGQIEEAIVEIIHHDGHRTQTAIKD